MGVKSTVFLTRKEAEDKYLQLYVRINARKILAEAFVMENNELEDILAEWNDEVQGGEGFENYSIHSQDPF